MGEYFIGASLYLLDKALLNNCKNRSLKILSEMFFKVQEYKTATCSVGNFSLHLCKQNIRFPYFGKLTQNLLNSSLIRGVWQEMS